MKPSVIPCTRNCLLRQKRTLTSALEQSRQYVFINGLTPRSDLIRKGINGQKLTGVGLRKKKEIKKCFKTPSGQSSE